MEEQKEIKDVPMSLATIEAFRHMLDVMEDFIRATEAERLEGDQVENQG